MEISIAYNSLLGDFDLVCTDKEVSDKQKDCNTTNVTVQKEVFI